MPLTLGIDCALRQLNLFLSDGEGLYGEVSLRVDVRQSELLPSVAEGFLSSLGRSFSELGLIAVTIGPGYYTGIRVGLSYASALAWSIGVKVAPIPTLYALAFGALGMARALGADACAAPVIGAGKNSLYGAVYRLEGDEVKSVRAPSFFANESFAEVLDSLDGLHDPLIVTPDGVPPGVLRKSKRRIVSAAGYINGSAAIISREVTPADPREIRASYLRDPA
ncbi:MAG: tRNA (adenosine(37)-N6)-threonylcarbamoyltransferase complex dimerization subunit type 1 TsaB [Synergistaceae bacterium]|jgi:tRNA threonylcarbamoyladenosine biosynthesis protein TsaB|nr:tRNA (adenosine(37)-N6)-threonylcarbamoyltransferase complex dimerization subunit type 1 TsaB [Synergistaceae bacterium]